MHDVTEFKWTIRKGNTARLAVLYRDPATSTPIPTVDCAGTLYIYDSGEVVLAVVATNDAPNGRFDIFLSKAEILELDFRQAEYEFNVLFPNGDETTLVDGPLVIESGRGPFE